MAESNGRVLAPPPLDLLEGASLFLDFDGTVVTIEARPDYVQVSPRLRSLLDQLSVHMKGRVAMVSGRAADEVRRLLNDPSFPISGSHGLETLWPDGRRAAVAMPEALHAVRAELEKLSAHYPAVWVEPKPYGAALHYRQAPEAEQFCRDLALELATETGLVLQPGKMVFELRAPGANKGSAVATLMAEPAMAGTRPIFIGDDATDEAGFAAAARLGGAGVLVGPNRETAAAYRLQDVADTLRWLAIAAGATA